MEQKEKYLNVKILNGPSVACFKNKTKETGDNKPDYKGDGVAIWINEVRDDFGPAAKEETRL